MLPNNSILFHELLWMRQILIQKRSLRFARTLVKIRPSSKQMENDNEMVNSQTESVLDQHSPCNYFGINEKEDMSFTHGYHVFDKVKHQEQVEQKYRPLMNPNKKYTTEFKKMIGLLNVRFDSENLPRFHGEFEQSEETVFKNLKDVVNYISKHNVDFNKPQSNEEFYTSKFSEKDFSVNEEIELKVLKTPPKSLTDDKINFHYANKLLPKCESKVKKSNDHEDWISYERSKREPKALKEKLELSLSEKIASIDFKPPDNDNISMRSELISGYEYLKQIRSGKLAAHFKGKFDDLKNLIKKEKLDTKGYRILTTQIPDFSKLTNAEVMDMLERQILFNDEDIVVINKPYGIAVHAAFGSMNEKFSTSTSRVNSKFHHIIHLGYFLPELAKRLECSKLYTVHRLDRDTTGVLLLAKTQEKAKYLNNLFKEQKIQKKYLCITKNQPDKPEGIIDIPIKLGHIKTPDGKKRERMVLCPEPLEKIHLQRCWSTAKRAITYYKIKSNYGNAALLEVTPETGIRHQIRVHLGFGLRCPILGDHKYSNLDSLLPQKLPSDILMALRIRQAKSRTVPMHLHAYLFTIPQSGKDGRNIFVRAPLPYHFQKNMRSLKLSLN